MTKKNITSFPCIHCDRDLLAGEDLQYTIFLQGISFIEGKNDGFVITVCPSCLKSTHIKLAKKKFDQIVEKVSVFDFRGIQYYEPLAYSSPYASSPDEKPSEARFQTYSGTGFTDHDTEVIEQELSAYEEENFSNKNTLYRTYVDGLALPSGSIFANLWLRLEDVHECIALEEQSGVKVFPRYIIKNEILEATDLFCGKYRVNEEFLGHSTVGRNSAEAYVINNAIKQIQNAHDKDTEKASEFHNILVADSNLVNSSFKNDATIKALLTNRSPFFGTDKNTLFHEVEINNGEEPYKEICQELHENFQKEFAQKFLMESVDDFIDDYLDASKKATWSCSDIMALKKPFLKRYYSAVKRGLQEEARYSFFDQGKAWKIIFDGREMPSLTKRGFKFIHFLVCNQNKSYYPSQLDSMINGMVGGISKEDHNEFTVSQASQYTHEPVDFEEKQQAEEQIKQLKKEFKEAQRNNDQNAVTSIGNNIKICKKYFKETYNSMEKNKEVKNIQSRIGKAIKEAIGDLYGRGHERAAKHFFHSIDPYANKICYRPIDTKIDWNT